MPNKSRKSRARKNGSRNFPTQGEQAPLGLIPHRVRCPRQPPDINSAPSFRRTVRQSQVNIGANASVSFTGNGIMAQDRTDYGSGSTNRFEAFALNGARVFAFGTTVTPPAIEVFVFGLTNSSSTANSVNAIFSDVGTVSDPCSVAFMWPGAQRQQNYTAGANPSLFNITNLSSQPITVMVDYDVTFTA